MEVVTQKHEYDVTLLVREHQAGVWRYLRYLGATAAEVDDLVQDTFLAFLRADFTYHTPAATAGYLRQVARNQLLQSRRRQGREVDTVELSAAESVWVKYAAEDHLEGYLALMRDCIVHLQGRPREVIAMQYEQGLGREAIATQLGMSVAGIKSLLRRTRQKLRECVERKVQRP